MRGFWSSATRLLVLQGSWTYERLQGIGTGFATLPLLRVLVTDPERQREAVARSVEYMNAHPYLAGIAVGAVARAEERGVAPGTIQRLKTALAGPLGSLGDQLFWIGVLPAVMAASLIGLGLGGGLYAVIGPWVVYVAIRMLVMVWGLQIGLDAGVEVHRAIKASKLPDQVRRVGSVAGFAVGMSLPLLVRWMAGDPPSRTLLLAGAVGALGGLLAARATGRVPTARRITVILLGVVFLWRWSVA
ncbi:MAG: PTS system mannose/fructose/sorbose family transporter subunit IID [Gemmatimonadales bacterium]